ncbi:MAG: hypothetical protein VXZ73_00750, partial [Pseudomonadota bacterium]|nr:hypothetical protein [Pseudomonadota bacterium]
NNFNKSEDFTTSYEDEVTNPMYTDDKKPVLPWLDEERKTEQANERDIQSGAATKIQAAFRSKLAKGTVETLRKQTEAINEEYNRRLSQFMQDISNKEDMLSAAKISKQMGQPLSEEIKKLEIEIEDDEKSLQNEWSRIAIESKKQLLAVLKGVKKKTNDFANNTRSHNKKTMGNRSRLPKKGI